mgnify:CR=1 FL=1|jgi:Sec-independent protein translocase protein TatA
MFGMSFPEFVIIALACFIFVGPKRMSSVAYEVGKWLNRFKTEITHFKETHIKGMDDSTYYEPKVSMNESLEEIKENQESTVSTSEKI